MQDTKNTKERNANHISNTVTDSRSNICLDTCNTSFDFFSNFSKSFFESVYQLWNLLCCVYPLNYSSCQCFFHKQIFILKKTIMI